LPDSQLPDFFKQRDVLLNKLEAVQYPSQKNDKIVAEVSSSRNASTRSF